MSPVPPAKEDLVEPEELEAFERAKRESFGQLLLKAARLLDERALEEVNRAPGRPEGVHVRPAHAKLLPHIDFAGVRITAIAERLGVTKQAVQPLVAELQAWGIVEVLPDPADGRARLVRYTPRGLEALQHGLGVLRALEEELATVVGRERIGELREVLAAVVVHLDRG